MLLADFLFQWTKDYPGKNLILGRLFHPSECYPGEWSDLHHPFSKYWQFPGFICASHWYTESLPGLENIQNSFFKPSFKTVISDTYINQIINPGPIDSYLIVHLYPNPANTQFTIEISGSVNEPITAVICDFTSRQLLSFLFAGSRLNRFFTFAA